MNILITGAYGFVGTNISAYLFNKGYALTALDQIQNRNIVSYTDFFSWDKFDQINFDHFDVIIHLAGKAHDTKNSSDAKVYFDVNTKLTQKVFDKFSLSKTKQFIFFSSVKAAADSVKENALTEDVIPHPIGPYGESKIAAEEYILQKVSEDSFPGNKKVYILRPCMIHGPANKGNLNLLFNIVSKGIPWPLGSFDNKRSFMNVWNLSFIIEQLLIKNPETGIYHLADDESISTNRLIQLISESQGKKAHILKWNKPLITGIAQLGGYFRMPLNPDRLRKLTETYIVSNQKIKQALGIERLPVHAEDGLRKTLESFSKKK